MSQCWLQETLFNSPFYHSAISWILLIFSESWTHKNPDFGSQNRLYISYQNSWFLIHYSSVHSCQHSLLPSLTTDLFGLRLPQLCPWVLYKQYWTIFTRCSCVCYTIMFKLYIYMCLNLIFCKTKEKFESSFVFHHQQGHIEKLLCKRQVICLQQNYFVHLVKDIRRNYK